MLRRGARPGPWPLVVALAIVTAVLLAAAPVKGHLASPTEAGPMYTNRARKLDSHRQRADLGSVRKPEIVVTTRLARADARRVEQAARQLTVSRGTMLRMLVRLGLAAVEARGRAAADTASTEPAPKPATEVQP